MRAMRRSMADAEQAAGVTWRLTAPEGKAIVVATCSITARVN